MSMTVKVNGEDYSRTQVRGIFEEGRKEINAHNIVDESGIINKCLKVAEKVVHEIGMTAEIDNDIENRYE